MESTKHKWRQEDTKKLISLYKRYQNLWNKNLKTYRDRDLRLKTIKDFSGILHVNENEVVRKLHNLRNQLVQEVRKIEKKMNSVAGGNKVATSKWPHYNAFKFLLPFIKCNETNSSLTLESSDNSNVEETPKKAKKHKMCQNCDNINVGVDSSKRPINEDEMFGQYVTMELKTLKIEIAKRQLKSAIRKVIIQISDMYDAMAFPEINSSIIVKNEFLENE